MSNQSLIAGVLLLGGAAWAGRRSQGFGAPPPEVLPGNYYITRNGRLVIQGTDEQDMRETLSFYGRRRRKGDIWRLHAPDGRVIAMAAPEWRKRTGW